MEYNGTYDDEGEPHGRGTLFDPESGVKFQGKFIHGVQNGRGVLWLPSGTGEEGDLDELQGTWVDGELHGRVTWTLADSGLVKHVEYKHGVITGEMKEYQGSALVYEGGCDEGGLRHGMGVEQLDSSGSLQGSWVHGVFTGSSNTWCYPPAIAPDGISHAKLTGVWDDEGNMQRAMYSDRCSASAGRMRFFFHWDPPSSTSLSSHPLLVDPWEQKRVYVAPSRIPNADGEGLFASVPMAAGEVASWYSGLTLTKDVVEARDWNDCDNTITVTGTPDTVIDVPRSHSSLSVYCATLGHKANHSFSPNARYAPVWHPRFGHIMSVTTIRPVQPDQELTVHYDYDPSDAPDWFYAEAKRTGIDPSIVRAKDFWPQ